LPKRNIGKIGPDATLGSLRAKASAGNAGVLPELADKRLCYFRGLGHTALMNVSLTKELEKVVEDKVRSGFYNNASEVVCDALRRAFTEIPALDLEQDTPELAALIRQGQRGRYVLHKRGDVRKMLARVHSRLGR